MTAHALAVPVPRAAPSRRQTWGIAALLTALALVLPLPGAAGPATAATPVRTLLSVVDPVQSAASMASLVRARGGQVIATFEIAGALLVDLPVGVTVPDGAVAVPDSPLHVTALPSSAADVPGATYRDTLGADPSAAGAGVTVAVVDTGVADVPDLAGRLTHVNVSGGPDGDGLGHGTFLAGLIAGDGTGSDGLYQGVAPAASILDVQVALPDGSTSMSLVLAGLQAVADRRAVDPSVDVLSLALSSGSPLPPAFDPLTRGLDRLWQRGVTVLVAAGNDGPAQGTVGSPGNDPTLITVGASDEHATSARGDDTVAGFSSRGSVFATGKPDLVAPGVSLVSTRAPGSIAETENPASLVPGGYMHGSGTSMAEAVAAGAAAVVIGVRPALTPGTVKALLRSTAYDAAGLLSADAGAGGLDLAAAVAAAPSARIVRTRNGRDRGDDSQWLVADTAAWAAFSTAWRSGDLDAVGAAWADLSPQARRWAASAFAANLVSSGLGTDSADYAALVALARRWATEGWDARRWADDAWVARRWADTSWSARRWALADFSARRWADTSWTARRWAAEFFDARRWADATWDARRWATEDFLAFAWQARRWASVDWTDSSWDARRWSARRWAAADFDAWAFTARRWSADSWGARRWSAVDWSLGNSAG